MRSWKRGVLGWRDSRGLVVGKMRRRWDGKNAEWIFWFRYKQSCFGRFRCVTKQRTVGQFLKH